MWVGLTFLTRIIPAFLFNLELGDTTTEDYFVRYEIAAQFSWVTELIVSVLILGMGFWITRLLPVDRKRTLLAVVFGGCFTVISLFNLNHVSIVGYDAYERGFPLHWLDCVYTGFDGST